MTKHEIEIPGLPEGYRAVEVRIDPDLTKYVGDDGNLYLKANVKLEKIKPRRIVLEETDEFRTPNHGEFYSYENGPIEQCDIDDADYPVRIWRVVEEE